MNKQFNNKESNINKDVAKEASLKYFNGDNLAADVFLKKYALKDKDGNLLEQVPSDMHKRLVDEFHRIESGYDNPVDKEYLQILFDHFKYIVPQGSPMFGIGNNYQKSSLGNCFVIGNTEDSYGGIMAIDQDIVQISKNRGGSGLDISHLRPHNAPVGNAALSSTGAVSFMERFSNTLREVAQDGRRAAGLISISIKHPDAEKFIDAKLDKKKVTGANISVKVTDEFLDAVINNKPFTQQFPINSTDPIITKEIDAKKLWNKLIENNHRSAEPGILFWDNIINDSIADCYKDYGFETHSTNPCLTGDTKVLVADGSGNEYTIKELAERGEDILVYCYDDDGNIAIRKMINPRLTGYNQKIYKITLEDGYTLRTTGNHKFLLTSGEYKRVDELVYGDSLKLLSKTATHHSSDSISDYYRFNDNSNKYEHRALFEHKLGRKLETDEIVHHKDENGLNNKLDNLELMTREEHSRLHVRNKPEEMQLKFKDNNGENNGRYLGITNEELLKIGINFAKSLNRRFSSKEWLKFATDNGYPKAFTEFREKELGTMLEFSKKCALLAGCNKDLLDLDTRVVKTYLKAEEQGYNCKIVNGFVHVEKFCEKCGSSFWKKYEQREISFCSLQCASEYNAKRPDTLEKRRNKIKSRYEYSIEIMNEKKEKQAKVYSDLKFKLGREPILKEWENACKKEGISYKLKSIFTYKNFDEVKQAGNNYNHKVISVEEDGYENVYNGTVEDFHNFFVGGFEGVAKNGKKKYIYFNNLNCGELPLPIGDSCRLLVTNLYHFVKNPFTPLAHFDFKEFAKVTRISQRMMDDLIDLEKEKIEKIINKIESDPEPIEIKYHELNLWKKVYKMLLDGRRTGLGISALGDVIAALGMRYSSDESIEFCDKLFMAFAQNVFISNINLAKERGHFPIFNYELEKDNHYVNRILDSFEDSEFKDQLISDYKKYGRRNISESTIAPTGSVSILLQTTSGIEPVFSIYYKRRRKLSSNSDIKVDFIDDLGDKWEEYNVIHPRFKDWYNVYCSVKNDENEKIAFHNPNSIIIDHSSELEHLSNKEMDELIKLSPYYKATANDLNWEGRVKLQGTIQKWISHSISSTVNLPSDVSVGIVDMIYKTAHKAGCKGITIYRDGCRDGVLITSNNEKQEANIFKENHAPKRGKSLPCEIMRFVNKGEKWIGFLGLLYGKPYEIFTGPAEEVPIPHYVHSGHIVKEKNGDDTNIYNFVWVDKDGFNQEFKSIARAFNREYQNIGRMVSAILRHGMPLKNVLQLIDKLELENEFLTNWKNGVKRMLKKYIADGTTLKGIKCPECGSTNMIFKDGCDLCADCGYTKCG